MEECVYNTICCFHNPIHKTTDVRGTQKEVGALWNTQNEQRKEAFEHLCNFNKRFVGLCDKT